MPSPWKPGDPLPEGELWTLAMVAQFAKRTPRTVQRWGIPKKGRGLYDPRTVRAFIDANHHLGAVA